MNVSEKVDRNAASPDGIELSANQPLERIRWAPCAQVVDGEEAAWDAMDLRIDQSNPAEVILEENSGPAAGNCDLTGKGSASVISETSQKIVIETQSALPGILVVADTWYPGWQAKIDGVSAPLLRANVLFMGVRLSQGSHRIEISYSPASFYTGAGISLLGILSVILWGFLMRHRVK